MMTKELCVSLLAVHCRDFAAQMQANSDRWLRLAIRKEVDGFNPDRALAEAAELEARAIRYRLIEAEVMGLDGVPISYDAVEVALWAAQDYLPALHQVQIAIETLLLGKNYHFNRGQNMLMSTSTGFVIRIGEGPHYE